MPFCPVCRYEYRPDVTVCPDCHQRLVEQLPTSGVVAATKPDDTWVGVCRIAGNLRSELAKGALDSNNIPSMLMPSAYSAMGGRQASRMTPAMSSGGTIMMVPKEFVHEAEIILEAVLGEDFVRLESRP